MSLPTPCKQLSSSECLYQPLMRSLRSRSWHIVPAAPTSSRHSVTDEKTKQNKAWKYEGYSGFSEWMASDDDFFIVRRFGTINARVILWMQNQIVEKERKLAELHKRMEDRSETSPDGEGMNDSFDWDIKNLPERHDLMRGLSDQLLQYNSYINAFSKVRARPAAEARQVRNLQNWSLDAEGLDREVIDLRELEFAKHRHDLISISSRERPPLGEWLESCQKLQLSKVFREKAQNGKHVVSAATQYTSNARFELLTKGLIITGGLVMLLAPIWWLAFVSDTKKRLGIITAFVCIFISVMATATNKPFEAVAATAAYAAVLMVFMQVEPKG
ncbi:hypothetical protein BU25DRAFT_443440 [Macroventuria anomochaeta]|uniref:Uncharacterized protein n=1 Tax=Macroventuria anomochaeta TaxID=301207 RepID=A0ACB6RLS2_9PLEO|nr:uncharacterized protein BU25DRAFT_443440 [Macroventuria anomochaeta]KAF2622058.1 hypothetical protein BU25DRAFT_443440 [Macroventuria anomochaeta]